MFNVIGGRPSAPEYTNEQLRDMWEAGDKWAGEVYRKRLRKYSALADSITENMGHEAGYYNR